MTNGFVLLLFGILVFLGRKIGIGPLLEIDGRILQAVAVLALLGLTIFIVASLRRIVQLSN
jgi:hypothetical protein